MHLPPLPPAGEGWGEGARTKQERDNITIQGTFLNIFNTGTLITGEPGIGKSELALGLLDRGHQLIADDAPIFKKTGDRIIGSNPLQKHFLHVRSLGLLDVTSLFGVGAIKLNQELQLIIHLQNHEGPREGGVLETTHTVKDIFGCLIPCETIPIINPRNLEVIIETIVKKHLLKFTTESFSVASFEEFLQQKMEQTHS